ncbi:MAG: DUF4406 domain-containing protein [Proteobacteria bacterium]|nr:DUF4406 domain-containing protein [Pseudomonadota bacterium]MBI3497843.1 DUF4406 domain-containing protein [Pseudomonadota bacterium]
MVGGPYRHGAKTAAERRSNLKLMNRAAHALFRMGHVPVIGVNMALPVIAAAGARHYDDIMLPLSLALTERCDAFLRVGGPSNGADAEMQRFRARGLPVFARLEDVPAADISPGG